MAWPIALASTPTAFIQSITTSIRQGISQEKEIKGIDLVGKEINMPLLVDDMIVYIVKAKDFITTEK